MRFPDPREVIPHRPPFLLIDKVLACDPTSIRAVRVFKPEEQMLAGHFPGRPIVPGVILVEAMAQALAYLELYHSDPGMILLASINRARFRAPVLPGEEVEFHVTIERRRMGLVYGVGEAIRGTTTVARADLVGARESS